MVCFFPVIFGSYVVMCSNGFMLVILACSSCLSCSTICVQLVKWTRKRGSCGSFYDRVKVSRLDRGLRGGKEMKQVTREEGFERRSMGMGGGGGETKGCNLHVKGSRWRAVPRVAAKGIKIARGQDKRSDSKSIKSFVRVLLKAFRARPSFLHAHSHLHSQA